MDGFPTVDDLMIRVLFTEGFLDVTNLLIFTCSYIFGIDDLYISFSVTIFHAFLKNETTYHFFSKKTLQITAHQNDNK